MDALPVTERTDVAFASRLRSTYEGQEVGVMHACGHDGHMAMLMGAATVLTRLRDQLSGTVKLIFQPAEEGTPRGEEGGAELMVHQGVLRDPDVDVIFGIHVNSEMDAITGAEDFSFFQQEVPGFFFFLGGKPKGVLSSEAAPHHAPDFYIDESGLKLGMGTEHPGGGLSRLRPTCCGRTSQNRHR